ncbi:hypothetical protein Q3G72_035101 [Acer saccharum]|nr:hypothetical protein Q3G72_020576 [Acer saccharum]KAK1548997.1 hypothetical protein Q3G72_035101 [Acer saccharum]
MQAKDDTVAPIDKEKPSTKMYGRLLNLASGTLTEKEFKQEKSNFWEEPYRQAFVWKPCVDRRTPNLDYDITTNLLVCFSAVVSMAKIQQAGALLVRRIRKYDSKRSTLDKQLPGNFIPNFPSEHQNIARGLSSYLALHLKFEEDMIAYSQCDFRGGKDERNELNFKHTVKSISLFRWNA